MARRKASDQSFNIMVVGHAGRLQYEALLFAASLRANAPNFSGKLIVAEPQPGNKWRSDPRMGQHVRDALRNLGAEVIGFENEHFGESYPYGNKIEGLAVLPQGEPFVFFDSDTLILSEINNLNIDFNRPTASMRRTGTWPQEELYWPGYTAIWKSLYDKFDLEFESTLDLSQPDEYWQRYLYFNAGWFLGSDPAEFGKRFLDWSVAIRDDTPEEVAVQSLDPWLDQVTLPLVVHSLGGGRPGPELDGFDGDITCHYRLLPLLYARESDRVVDVLEDVSSPNKIKKVLKEYEPMKKMIFQGKGKKLRAQFDQANLPKTEKQLRNQIKNKGFWFR